MGDAAHKRRGKKTGRQKDDRSSLYQQNRDEGSVILTVHLRQVFCQWHKPMADSRTMLRSGFALIVTPTL